MENVEIYESMIQKKGLAYRDSQVLPENKTHYRDPIDTTPGRAAGNSHVVGDANPEVQSRAIDALIIASERAGLDAHQIGYVLAIARHESGFNPDAAAGSTTAYGLGQFVTKTGEKYGINDANRGDLTKQAEALVAHYKDNATLVAKYGHGEEYIYKFHHDGPVADSGGLEISRKHVMPYVGKYEEFARQHQKEHGIFPADPAFDTRNHITTNRQQHAAHTAMNHGDRGAAVHALQVDLAALGYTDNRGRALQADGHYGPNTEAAVRAFQNDHGLSSDGVAGRYTLQTIQDQRALAAMPAVAPELDGFPGQAQVARELSFEQRLDRMLAAAETGDWKQFSEDTRAMANMPLGREMWAHTLQIAGIEDKLITQQQQHLADMQQMQQAAQQPPAKSQGRSL